VGSNSSTSLLALVGLGFLVAAGASLALIAVVPLLAPLTVFAVGVITVVALATALRRRILVRLRRITSTLQKASARNYVVRCQTGDDEVGAVGRQVNRLLEKLTDLSVDVIDTDRELQWTQKELKLKEELTEKSRLLQATNRQLESRLSELSLLFSTSRALSSSLELRPLLRNFCRSGAKAMAVDRFAIFVYDERPRALVVEASYGFEEGAGQVQGMRFSPGEGASGTVFEKKTMLYIRDLNSDHRFLHFRGKVQLDGSALILPLPSGEHCVGVMLLIRNRTDGFPFEDVGLFHIVANQVAGAVGNALLYRKTRELATHDELTGLYNRRLLETRLEMEWERAQRFASTLACIMVDVDHFKKFNDEHGHLVGDKVLKHAAQVVLNQVRKVDTVARFGGEEFAILLPRTTKAEAHAVAEKLRQQAMSIPVPPKDPDREPLPITVSAGVSSTEDRPENATALIDLADHALLVAKASGRNQVVDYGSFSTPG